MAKTKVPVLVRMIAPLGLLSRVSEHGRGVDPEPMVVSSVQAKPSSLRYSICTIKLALFANTCTRLNSPAFRWSLTWATRPQALPILRQKRDAALRRGPQRAVSRVRPVLVKFRLHSFQELIVDGLPNL